MERIIKIENLNNGIVKLDDSYIELKLIGGILVERNSEVVRIDLKNGKRISVLMSKSTSKELTDMWLAEFDRRELEGVRCSEPKNSKNDKPLLSDIIADRVIEAIDKIFKSKEKQC